jgi:glycosyltransferase involved in cell wall biosynthesis
MNNGVEIVTRPASVRRDSDDTCVRLVFVGRLVEQKRCIDVLRACARLKSSSSRWSLAVVGDGPLREVLESEASRLGLGQPQLAFLGFRADAITLIAQSDILVVASEIEGMPNVVLEAMSVAVPIVATDVGGIPRMLGEVGRQYMFSVGDVDRLSELLGLLLSDARERRSYGNALRQRCEMHYQIDGVARAYLEAYGRLQ